jgi:hypothetical protein
MDERPSFSVDEMLGSLARWLRIMGYDAVYHRDEDDTEIVDFAMREGRYLLTRDRELAARAGEDGLYIDDDDVMEQLSQVSEEFDLSLDESMTRCTVCNGPLEVLGREEVKDDVPEGALKENDRFYRCRRCGKLYWKGSHWTDIRAKLDSLGQSQSR